MVYSRAERVFILEHYFPSKSFPAVRGAFSNTYPDKYRIRQQYADWQQNFRTQEVFVCDKCSSSDRAAEITAYLFQAVHQLQQRDTAARIQYCHWFSRFVREGVHVG
jgi:hypothetical protein